MTVPVEFVYPAAIDERIDYVTPFVLLEPGTHAEFIPKGEYDIQPFAAAEFPMFSTEKQPGLRPSRRSELFGRRQPFSMPNTIVRSTSRWPARHSRTYYDLAVLAGTDIRRRGVADPDLLARVVKHKMEFVLQQLGEI